MPWQMSPFCSLCHPICGRLGLTSHLFIASVGKKDSDNVFSKLENGDRDAMPSSCGTPCPFAVGRNALFLWDAMPFFCGTQCPFAVGRHAQVLWDAMPFETLLSAFHCSSSRKLEG